MLEKQVSWSARSAYFFFSFVNFFNVFLIFATSELFETMKSNTYLQFKGGVKASPDETYSGDFPHYRCGEPPFFCIN